MEAGPASQPARPKLKKMMTLNRHQHQVNIRKEKTNAVTFVSAVAISVCFDHKCNNNNISASSEEERRSLELRLQCWLPDGQ